MTSRAARRSTSRSTTSTRPSTARRALRLLVRGHRRRGAVGQPDAPGDQRRPALERDVGGLNAPPSALAGWSVDVHHTYDPVGRTLYMGDGSKRSAEGQNFDVISTTKTGLAARPRAWSRPSPTATLLVADSSAHVIRRIAPGGAMTVVAGTGTAGLRRRRRPGRRGAVRPSLRRRGRARRRDLRRRRGQQPHPPDRRRDA